MFDYRIPLSPTAAVVVTMAWVPSLKGRTGPKSAPKYWFVSQDAAVWVMQDTGPLDSVGEGHAASFALKLEIFF